MKSRIWIFETCTRIFTYNFSEEIYGDYALSLFCKDTGIYANAVIMFYSIRG